MTDLSFSSDPVFSMRESTSEVPENDPTAETPMPAAPVEEPTASKPAAENNSPNEADTSVKPADTDVTVEQANTDGAIKEDAAKAPEGEATAQQAEPAAPSEAGRVVRGKIAAILEEQAIIELIGSRGKGVIALDQFPRTPRVGAISDFVVLGEDADAGQLILGREENIRQNVAEQFEVGQNVIAQVTGSNKGGLELELVGGIRAFMPTSQIDVRPLSAEQTQGLVGQRVEAVVSKIEKGRKIFISRRSRLEEQLKEKRTQLLNDLVPGTKTQGRVIDIKPFGVFVDLGGLDGMIPISELSHGYVEDPATVVTVNQEITVKVTGISKDKKGRQRIGLSLKALSEDPAANLEGDFEIGSELTGEVVKTAAFWGYSENP